MLILSYFENKMEIPLLIKNKNDQENDLEFFLKPWKMNFDKRRQIKLDKLEKEGGRTIRPKKNTKYTVEEGKTVKIVISKP